jgi:hypothetical protein
MVVARWTDARHLRWEWFGKTVEPIGVTLHGEEELTDILRGCDFAIDDARRRANLPHEAETERLRRISRRPSAGGWRW